jgi:hypothetical protein
VSFADFEGLTFQDVANIIFPKTFMFKFIATPVAYFTNGAELSN